MASAICSLCHRHLKDPVSIQNEMGPVCRAKVEAERFGEEPDPCSMTDPLVAAATLHELKQRILDAPDKRDACWCGEPLAKCAVVAMDHEGGTRLAGFAKAQWIVFRCAKCGYEMAMWKVNSRVDLTGLEPPMEETL